MIASVLSCLAMMKTSKREWEELAEEERQVVTGPVSVGHLHLTIKDDTDRIFVDLLVDSSLADWRWFLNSRPGFNTSREVFSDHVAAIASNRDKQPCTSFDLVDWGNLEDRVLRAAKNIEQQALRHPDEKSLIVLYGYVLGVAKPSVPRRVDTSKPEKERPRII